MREIKFRAWDRKSQRMFENVSTGTLTVFGNNHEHADHEDCVFMQYTGLKDKNGKEIYEGDIVQNGNDKKPNQQIIFAKGMFCLDDEDSPLWKYAPQHFWEIIGNIYENPELLNPHTT